MTDKPKPNNIVLYEKIEKEKSEKYKHSAYRSGLIVKKYKSEYMKKYKSEDAYVGDKPKMSNLQRWFLEDWKNQRGDTGYQKKGDVYRPTIRINKDTPKTFSELSQSQIERAKKEKAKKGRVKRF